jgi:hypothetical protein
MRFLLQPSISTLIKHFLLEPILLHTGNNRRRLLSSTFDPSPKGFQRLFGREEGIEEAVQVSFFYCRDFLVETTLVTIILFPLQTATTPQLVKKAVRNSLAST